MASIQLMDSRPVSQLSLEEVEKAKTSLAVEASLLALNLAEGKIKKTMDKKDHERIMKDYISRVGGTE